MNFQQWWEERQMLIFFGIFLVLVTCGIGGLT